MAEPRHRPAGRARPRNVARAPALHRDREARSPGGIHRASRSRHASRIGSGPRHFARWPRTADERAGNDGGAGDCRDGPDGVRRERGGVDPVGDARAGRSAAICPCVGDDADGPRCAGARCLRADAGTKRERVLDVRRRRYWRPGVGVLVAAALVSRRVRVRRRIRERRARGAGRNGLVGNGPRRLPASGRKPDCRRPNTSRRVCHVSARPVVRRPMACRLAGASRDPSASGPRRSRLHTRDARTRLGPQAGVRASLCRGVDGPGP